MSGCHKCGKEPPVDNVSLIRTNEFGVDGVWICTDCLGIDNKKFYEHIMNGYPDIPIIKETKPSECEMCGTVAELRPYGSNGEYICFDCGMKDEEMTKRRMNQHLFGEGFDA